MMQRAGADDMAFKWVELILDHLWLLFPFAALIYLWRHPEILRSVTRLRIGDFEVQLEHIQKELQATKEATQQLAESNSNIARLIEGLDINAPVAELREASRALKAQASHLDGAELEQGLAGLKPGADPAALHASAVVARKRTDPASLPQLMDRLDSIASSPTLDGIRLNTVWMLASAAHLTLVAIYKHQAEPQPDRALLERARTVFDKLIANPMVQGDRPDDPSKGVRGPAEKALRYITTALSKA
jgi:hypothetical protein